MEKRLTFNSLTYSLSGQEYELDFRARRLSFRGPGPRLLIGQVAKILGMADGEMKAYIRGLREMRSCVRSRIRRLENARRFCGPEHQRQLSGPVPDREMAGYLQALKDVERICGRDLEKVYGRTAADFRKEALSPKGS